MFYINNTSRLNAPNDVEIRIKVKFGITNIDKTRNFILLCTHIIKVFLNIRKTHLMEMGLLSTFYNYRYV